MIIAQLIACTFMCGVVWIIQLLHYPAFREVDAARFADFHRGHTQRMGYIVAPVMLIEIATATLLLLWRPNAPAIMANFIMLMAIWILTFMVSVPLHNSLAQNREDFLIEKLIQTNWPRTVLWSSRVVILARYLYVARAPV